MLRTTLSTLTCSLFVFLAIDLGCSQLLAQLTVDDSGPSPANFEGDIFMSRYEVGNSTTPKEFVLRSGTMTIGEELSIKNGNFEVAGGNLNANSLQFPTNFGLFAWPEIVGLDTPWSPFEFEELPFEFAPVEITPPIEITLIGNQEQQFHQRGGAVTFDEEVNLRSGNVIVDEGAFSAGSMIINGLSDSFGSATFRQNGGQSTFDSILIDNGSLEINDGILTANSLAMGDPASQTALLSRSPEVNHTGGDVQISGNVELCIPGAFPSDVLQLFPFESVTYRLGNGNLSVGGDLIVGSMGAAPADFIQTGGENRVGGTLRIEGVGSNYDLQSGSLMVDRLHVATDLFNTNGSFAMSSGATLQVSEEVVFGADATFGADADSTMHFSGASFSILGSDEVALSGLDSLSLIIDGTDETTSLEVAGLDLGMTDQGFVMNFSMHLLQIGDESSATVQLVDLIDNNLLSNSNDALYVDTLDLAAGSTLDLNGLAVYYRELNLGDNASIIGSAVAVPEPGNLLPLFFGLLALARLGKCRQNQFMRRRIQPTVA